jgi:hypothetical protein
MSAIPMLFSRAIFLFIRASSIISAGESGWSPSQIPPSFCEYRAEDSRCWRKLPICCWRREKWQQIVLHSPADMTGKIRLSLSRLHVYVWSGRWLANPRSWTGHHILGRFSRLHLWLAVVIQIMWLTLDSLQSEVANGIFWIQQIFSG